MMSPDIQLLHRYAATRDADAFTQLVRRHAGMVYGVARRITGDHHDAEDVAQG
jgi:DNA-directed RNA polymerase specialized sigma24 family protein